MKDFTRTLPLEDHRDLMARVGTRFIWCTGPYFLLALVMSSLGNDALLKSWTSLAILFIPIIGAVIDWRRLNSRGDRAAT